MCLGEGEVGGAQSSAVRLGKKSACLYSTKIAHPQLSLCKVGLVLSSLVFCSSSPSINFCGNNQLGSITEVDFSKSIFVVFCT